MNHLRYIACAASFVFLCQCTTKPTANDESHPPATIADSLIPMEHSAYGQGSVRDYRMIHLVCALPIWESNPEDRGRYIAEYCKQEPSEDLFSIEALGAQQGYTILRLDKDLVAVISHAEMEGQINDVRVLRRIPDAWQDLTTRTFPYTIDKMSRIRGNRDKSMIVREPGSATDRTFIWSGSRYVEK